jgi:hypothetical protein
MADLGCESLFHCLLVKLHLPEKHSSKHGLSSAGGDITVGPNWKQAKCESQAKVF